MIALLRQLWMRPAHFAELLGASFFIHLLALAGTVFVILVFNNYLPYGVNATLVTLAVGALIATLAEAAFRQVRHRLIDAGLTTPVRNTLQRSYTALTRARMAALDTRSMAWREESLRALDVLEQVAAPTTVASVLDVPFALLALMALFFISPALCVIALVALGLALLVMVVARPSLRRAAQETAQQDKAVRALATAAVERADTVRVFRSQGALLEAWMRVRGGAQGARARSAALSARSQTLTAMISAWQGLAIIGVGAVFAVAGDLSAGALIGANILAARALAPLLRIAALADLFARAEVSSRQVSELLNLPQEADAGVALKDYAGGVELVDVAFVWPGSALPLFEHLSLRLAPGTVLGVVGGNGSGKTTLARLLCGLIEPQRGQILADGVDLRQVDPAAWRRALRYLPQEPSFVDASVAENLGLVGMDESQRDAVLQAAGLRTWIDGTAQGLDTPLSEGGRALSLGIRKRLALARALACSGRLAVFDEPTDALDDTGRQAVYAALNALKAEGVTVVVFTHDPYILKAADGLLDLGVKPEPRVVYRQAPVAEREEEANA